MRSCAYELYGRSGLGMDGAAPLKWSELTHYEHHTGYGFSLAEKRCLMQLDAILRNPDSGNEA